MTATVAARQFSERSTLVRTGDRYLLVGTVLVGSIFLGPLGIPFLVVAFLRYRQAQKAGELTRPWAVTIIATFCLIDSIQNGLAWSFEVFAHDTSIVSTFVPGYGKLVDAAYYVNYNSGAFGGTANSGEKALQIFGVGVMYPIRIVAAWSFLKMRRRGLDQMIWSTYIYVAFWFVLIVNMYISFGSRFGPTEFGVVGWWTLNFIYTSPFIMMPFLWTLNRSLFSEDSRETPEA